MIFYTGGNETRIAEYYENMLNSNEVLNIKNGLWYSFFNNKLDSQHKCLDKNVFLTKHNFKVSHPSLNMQNYINKGFKKIKKDLKNKDIDFLFYIHPFNNEINGAETMKLNVKKIKKMNIPESNFINLSNKKFDIDFIDNYHTRNSNFIAGKIFNDILENYQNKINDKIFKKVN